jgi:hypothetical protein
MCRAKIEAPRLKKYDEDNKTSQQVRSSGQWRDDYCGKTEQTPVSIRRPRILHNVIWDWTQGHLSYDTVAAQHIQAIINYKAVRPVAHLHLKLHSVVCHSLSKLGALIAGNIISLCSTTINSLTGFKTSQERNNQYTNTQNCAIRSLCLFILSAGSCLTSLMCWRTS